MEGMKPNISEDLSVNTLVRSKSVSKFMADGTAATRLAMDFEIEKLIEKAKSLSAEEYCLFKREMKGFQSLFCDYLGQKFEPPLDWSAVKSISPQKLILYNEIINTGESRQYTNKQLLDSLVVLKLNGGLGTTMGCVGPKSAIEVRNHMTFLDLIVRQIEWLNEQHDSDVPLLLMNSFNTDKETKKIIQKYANHRLSILTFNQSRYPRIGKDDLLPIPTDPIDNEKSWYPPGHGDLCNALYNSGVLNQLLSDGKEVVFISNVDNLGATVDLKILEHMKRNNIDFLMEVTDKTKADIKGGTLIEIDGQVRLLEVAQVPNEYIKEFVSVEKFKVFNTNNIWINLKALKQVIEKGNLKLDLLVNLKHLEPSCKKIIQLENAIGSAIKHFDNAVGINVPRSRFLPVKSCSDLFLIQSDLYSLSHGELILNTKRTFNNTVPLIKLGSCFQKVQDYLSRFAGPPHILDLDHLTVSGDISFGTDVTLKGTVIIVANSGSRIDIPSGSVLHDKVVSGNLRILDH